MPVSFNMSLRLQSFKKISMIQRLRFRKDRDVLHHRDVLHLTCVTPDKNINPHFIDFDKHESMLIYQPHNLWKLFYLDLAETWYTMDLPETTRFSESSERKKKYNNDYCLRKYVLQCMVHYFLGSFRDSNYPLPSKFVKSFFHYLRLTKLCKKTELSTQYLTRVLEYLGLFHKDSDLVCDLLTTLCKTNELKVHLFSDYTCQKYLEYVLRMCNEARFDIRSFLTEYLVTNRNCVLRFCPVLHCLMQGHETSLTMVLNHGFGLCKLHLEDMFQTHLHYNVGLNCFFQLNVPAIIRECHVNRKQFLIVTLYILYAEGLGELLVPTQWIRCGFLLFRSIPEPYIYKEEMVHLFGNYYMPLSYRKSIMITYERNFEGIGSKVYEPRKLQHLCRCSIRRRLSDNFELPIGISKLGLPEKLILYLRLES